MIFKACAPVPPAAEIPCHPQKVYTGAPSWEDLVKDAQKIKSLSARVEIIYNQGSSGKLKGILLYQPPGSLRFEALSPWGQPGAYLIIKDRQFSYFTFGDNRLVMGSAKGPWLKDFMGLELPLSWLLALLSGRGRTAESNPLFLGMKEMKEGREFYLQYVQENFQEILFWDGASGEIKEVKFVSLKDGLEVKALYENFICSQDQNFPQKIFISSPAGLQAQITLSQIELNRPLEASLFEPPAPQEGMKVYQLD